jgi:hypothetical protein
MRNFLRLKKVTNNNKQTTVDAAELAFKLYPFSSDSVRNAFITGYNKAKEMECVLLCAKEQKSMELPSDEEIEKESFDLYANHNTYSLNVRQYKAFKGGAKWMRDKIRIQGR